MCLSPGNSMTTPKQPVYFDRGKQTEEEEEKKNMKHHIEFHRLTIGKFSFDFIHSFCITFVLLYPFLFERDESK